MTWSSAFTAIAADLVSLVLDNSSAGQHATESWAETYISSESGAAADISPCTEARIFVRR